MATRAEDIVKEELMRFVEADDPEFTISPGLFVATLNYGIRIDVLSLNVLEDNRYEHSFGYMGTLFVISTRNPIKDDGQRYVFTG